MKAHAAALLLVAWLPIVACDAAATDDARNGLAPTAATAGARTTDIPPPSTREIVRAGWGGTERGRYDAARSVYVERDTALPEVTETGVWHRLAFTSGDRRYVTGLTAARTTAADTGEPPAPVSLGQATFVLEGGRWQAVDGGFVGQLAVNASGNPAAIDRDQSRVPSPHALSDGRMLFAIRLTDFAQGTRLERHAVLLFDPRGMARAKTRRTPEYPNGSWSLVAMLPTGSDNAAACDGGAVMPCAADSATLRFGPSGNGLPDIRVQRAGSEIVGPGKVRRLGPGDTTTYRFDPTQGDYVPRRER